jgi:hypothetical protein
MVEMFSPRGQFVRRISTDKRASIEGSSLGTGFRIAAAIATFRYVRRSESSSEMLPMVSCPFPRRAAKGFALLENENFGASRTNRSIKCNKLHTRHGCECQKIGIRPHFR